MLVPIREVIDLLGISAEEFIYMWERNGKEIIQACKQEDIREFLQDRIRPQDWGGAGVNLNVIASTPGGGGSGRNNVYQRVLELAGQRCPGSLKARKVGKASFQLTIAHNGRHWHTMVAMRSSKLLRKGGVFFFGLDSESLERTSGFAFFICASAMEVMTCQISQIPVLVVPIGEVQSLQSELSRSTNGNVKLMIRNNREQFFLLTADGKNRLSDWSRFLRSFDALWEAPTTQTTDAHENMAVPPLDKVGSPPATDRVILSFPFRVNKSFIEYDHHPITIPRKYHSKLDDVDAFQVDDAVVIGPSGSQMKGRIYTSQAGYGGYYQIMIKGCGSDDPLHHLEIGRQLNVQVARKAGHVVISLK